MVTWDLSQIITKVRNVTGTPSTDQLTDLQITDYINTYYTFTMPFELKEQINLQPFNFQTIGNQDVYRFDGLTQTGQPMAYTDGFPLIFYNDRDIFFQDWPQQYASDNVAAGDGITTNFAGNTQAFPIIAGTYFITDGSQIVTDVPNDPFDGTGTFTGDGAGTINYVTGAFSVTFNTAPDSVDTIYDKYQPYQPARPQGVLLDATQINTTDQISLTFRPVPDQVYAITLQGYIIQGGMALASDMPLQSEWGQLIAYGASLEVFSDRGDLVAYNNYYPILKRYENVALGRFVQQLDGSQSVPRF